MTHKINGTQKLVLCAMFAALIAVGAFIRIPIGPVPFTMQVFFVLLAGMMLGKKWGSASALLYMATGLVGIPVFTDGGELSYFVNPKFGYIIGFVAAAFVIGLITERQKPGVLRSVTAGFAGIGIIYLIGVTYYWAISYFYLGKQLSFGFLMIYCFLITLPSDILSCILASAISVRIARAVKVSA